jgi:hypothetical protein
MSYSPVDKAFHALIRLRAEAIDKAIQHHLVDGGARLANLHINVHPDGSEELMCGNRLLARVVTVEEATDDGGVKFTIRCEMKGR